MLACLEIETARPWPNTVSQLPSCGKCTLGLFPISLLPLEATLHGPNCRAQHHAYTQHCASYM